MWLKFGQRRGHRSHAGRDAHRRGQDVIDHQRGCGKQTCFFPQVLRCHGVAAAAARVCGNGLPIAKIDDHQQDQNGRNDGNQVLCPEQP